MKKQNNSSLYPLVFCCILLSLPTLVIGFIEWIFNNKSLLESTLGKIEIMELDK